MVQSPAFSELFQSSAPANWTFQPVEDAGKNWLVWQGAGVGAEPGWSFVTEGRVSAYRDWDVGTRPFVFEFEMDLTRGQNADWRENGAFVMISSAPVYEMGWNDLGMSIGVMQSGVQATVKMGPFYELGWREEWGAEVPENQRRSFVHSDLAPRGVLSRGGGGGMWQSLGWPGQRLEGQRLRFRIERTEDHFVRFSIYHSAGDPAEPVWEGVFQLPDHFARRGESLNLRDIPLRYVNVLTTLNNPPSSTEVRSQDVLAGRIFNMLGVAAPGRLPRISRFFGELSEGGVLRVVGESFQNGATILINGKAQQTKFLNPTTLEARLSGISLEQPGQLSVANPDGTLGIHPHPLQSGHVITEIRPGELRRAGGEKITLRGRGFTEQTRVSINGKEAPVELVSATELQVTTPPGEGAVKLEARDGTRVFQIEAPVAYASHPYLLIQPGDVEKLRQRLNAPHMQYYKKMILRLADRSAQPEAMTRKAMSLPDYGENIWATTWAYLLTGEERYKEAALRWIAGTVGPSDILRSSDPTRSEELRLQHEKSGGLTAADPDPSNPGILIQFLNMHQFQIQRGTAVAIAYDLLFEEIPPELRARMLDYMNAHIALAVPLIQGNDWWYAGNPSNTVAVANNAVGLMALAQKEIRNDIPALAELTSKTIKSKFRAIEADGGCVEGTLYWNYGLTAQIQLGMALQNVLGNDFGLLQDPRLEKGIHFAQVALGGDGNMFVFNDSQPWLQGTVPAALGGSRYNQVFMRWLVDAIMERYSQEEQIVSEVVRPTYTIPAFLMRGDEPPVETMPPLPTLATLEVMQWGVMRSSSDAHKKGVVVGIKGKGGLTTHHVHGDQGNFVLHAHGREFFLDAGYGHGNAFKHSIPIPARSDSELTKGGEKFKGFRGESDAPLIKTWEDGDLRTITVDSTLAYRDKDLTRAEKVHRVFALAGDKALVILDDVRPSDDMPVVAQYQVARPPEIESASRFHVLRDGARVDAYLFGPELDGLTPMALDIKQRGWVYRHMGVDWHRLSGCYKADPDRPLVTVLQPVNGNTPAPPPQARFGNGEVTVTIPGYSRNLVFVRNQDDWELKRP